MCPWLTHTFTIKVCTIRIFSTLLLVRPVLGIKKKDFIGNHLMLLSFLIYLGPRDMREP